MEVLIKTTELDEEQHVFLLPLKDRDIKNKELDDDFKLDEIADPSITDEDVDSLNSFEEDNKKDDDYEKEKFYEELKVKAYAEGYSEGLEEVALKYDQELEKIDLLLSSINDAIPEYLIKSEAVIASIVFESVCKIIGAALIDKTNVLELIKHTINQVEKEKIREIYISQNDYALICNLGEDLTENSSVAMARIDGFKFKVDPMLKIGGAKIKLIEGLIDASVDGQLEILAKSLKTKAVTFT
jgi:flagellar biosynthesis/type III secretory pathway protein FliH